MANDLFAELAEVPVPPLPADFDSVVHRRVNRSLIAMHVLDFVVHGLPWAMLQFGKGVIGLMVFTLTGQHLVEGRKRNKGPEE